MSTQQAPNGWVYGNFDGFAGTRIYPSWQGALDGKRITCRDIRMFQGKFLLHNPWRNVIEHCFETIGDVEQYIALHGVITEPGANVWD